MKKHLVLEYRIRKLEKFILEDIDSDLDKMSDNILKKMPSLDLDAELDDKASALVGKQTKFRYDTINDWLDSAVFSNKCNSRKKENGIIIAIRQLKGMVRDHSSKSGRFDFGLRRSAELKSRIRELQNTNLLIANQKMVSALRKKIKELESELKNVKQFESALYEGKRDQEILNNFLGDEYYDKYSKVKGKIKDPEYKDIYKLIKKDPDDVKDYIDNIQSSRDIRRTEKSGAKKIYEDPEWVVYKITTYDAAKHYGKGTRWCITGNYDGHEERGEDFFNDYIDDYDLDGGYYFYINKKNRSVKYCLLQDVNGEIRSIWDASDKNLGSRNIAGLPKVPGVNLESANPDDFLIAGTQRGDVTLVKKALSMGSDVNAEDAYGVTALMSATRSDYPEIVKLLINAGADVNVSDIDTGDTALISAVTNDNIEIVKLLLNASADVNAKTIFEDTALMRAAFNGQREIVKLLLDAGADVNLKDEYGVTALMNATYKDHIEIVKLLIDAGADVNAKSQSNDTALMYALKNGHNDIAELLISHGAKSESRRKYNRLNRKYL